MTYPQWRYTLQTGTLKNFAVGITSNPGGPFPSGTTTAKQVQHPGTPVYTTTISPYPSIESDITANPPDKSLPKATIRNIYKYRKEALLNQKIINNRTYVSATEDTLLNNINLCNSLRNIHNTIHIWDAYKSLLYFGDNNITIHENLHTLTHKHITQIKILKETAIILIIALFGVVLTLAPYGISLTLGITGRLLERWGLGFLLLLLSGGVLAAITLFIIFLHRMAEGLIEVIVKRYERTR